jgi:ArsR family transcriptional regulator
MVKPIEKVAAERCCPPRRLRSEIPKELARVFRALADETRLEMVGLLAATDGGELCVCDIEEHFQLAQPTISHHLKVLRDAQLVSSERRASWVYYRLDRDAMAAVADVAASASGRTPARRR